jgi:hypothetical protein
MVDGLKEAQAKAGAKFEKDPKAAQDGAEARAKHEAEARAVDEKSARLRSLRLAKEAADKEAAAHAKGAATKKKRSP